MKKYIFLLFLLFATSIYCQNTDIVLLVKDSTTDAVIPEVNVFAQELNKSGKTNSQGAFKLVLHQHVNLIVGHPKYQNARLNSSILNEKVNIIYLDPKPISVTEKEIVVTNPKNVLAMLIENSKKSITKPVVLNAYVLEFYKKNKSFYSFNDGLLSCYITKRGNKTRADIFVEQNRFYSLDSTVYQTNSMGYNLNKLLENNYTFTYLDGLLNTKNQNKYNYYFSTSVVNPDHYKLKIELKADVAEALPNFEIIYDYSKLLLISVTTIMPDSALKFEKVKKVNRRYVKSIYSYQKVSYKIQDQSYYFSSSIDEVKVEEQAKNRASNTFSVKNYFVVNTAIFEALSFNKKQAFRKKSLNKISTKYYNNYWDFNSGLTPTTEEAEIIQQLSSETLN